MKIVEIIPNLQTGGAEKFVIDLTNEMIKLNNLCTIVTLFELNSDDILVSYLDDNVKKVALCKHLGFDIKCLFRLYKYIRNEKPDIVHAHTGAITYLILSALLYRRCGYIVTIHNDAKADAGKGVRKLIRKFLIKFKLVVPVTISEESERSFQNYYGLSGNLISNGCSDFVNSEKLDDGFYRKDVDYLFVHVGRFHKAKNQICLVKAFERLLKDGIKARLLMIGRKEDVRLFDLISPYFSTNIVYVGEQINPRKYMEISDAFCMSSLWEGMPITIIEAFSVGCTPIVTPVGGCINMIEDGVNGILAKNTSESAYYQALKRYVSLDENTKMKMSQNALNSYEKQYSIKKTASDYIELFSLKKQS